MTHRNDTEQDERFRIRPGAPKQQGDKFLTKVLRQSGKSGGWVGAVAGKAERGPGARLGRGHVAARFAGRSLPPNARRVAIKIRLVNLTCVGARSTAVHLRYLEREGVDRRGGVGQAYGPETDAVDLDAFRTRCQGDRHQFRMIVAPEDAEQLDDLRTYARHFLRRMEADLGSRLEWVAVDHWNTDNPHTHIVLRGKDDTGKDLIIARDYIAEGMRYRASALATEWLGPRTALDIQRAMRREIDQERWTQLDRTLQGLAAGGLVQLNDLSDPRLQHQRQMLVGRLERLTRMGLATEQRPGVWALLVGAEPTLRAMGERGDIVRIMQRAMSGQPREYAIFPAGREGYEIVGRVVGKGLANELYDQGYLLVDGIDGRAHYVALPSTGMLEQYPMGAVVEAKGTAGQRAVDRQIVTLAVDGVYRTGQHIAIALAHDLSDREATGIAAGHVRRLEALRRDGLVERLAEGVWRVPADLAERGSERDTWRPDNAAAVALRSHLPIERQIDAIGATWLDQQLIGGGRGLADLGFGAEAQSALRQRADVLVDQGLATRHGNRIVLARNLLDTLCERELAKAGQETAAQTGLAHRPVEAGQRVAGVYARNITLSSGRYAMLVDGAEFCLVPWKPVIEPHIGRAIAARVSGTGVSWEIGREVSR